MPFTVYGVFCFATFTNSYTYKLIVPEAHFHVDTIGASPALIARKTAKLFTFLYSLTQRDPTIVEQESLPSLNLAAMACSSIPSSACISAAVVELGPLCSHLLISSIMQYSVSLSFSALIFLISSCLKRSLRASLCQFLRSCNFPR